MVDFFQQLSLVKRFRSKVAIAEITDTRFDEKFLIDFRIDCRRNDPHLRESVRYRMHTCSKKKKQQHITKKKLEFSHYTLTSKYNRHFDILNSIHFYPPYCLSFIIRILAGFFLLLLNVCKESFEPEAAIRRETTRMFFSGTSWSRRTRMAIIAAAPVATVASIRITI